LDLFQQISSKITESHEFLEELTFSDKTNFQISNTSTAVFEEVETSRCPGTWKSCPKIKCLVRPQEVTHYRSFLLYRSNSQRWMLPCNVSRFPLPWTTTRKPCWQSLVSARRCILPLCFDSASVMEWLLPHKWIGRAGPVSWPTPSPLLTPLDSLWGQFKTDVYSSKPRH